MNYFSNITRSEGDPRILRTGRSSMGGMDRLARGIGWFSIGLGIVQLLAAKRITRALGMRGSENLVRAFGVRELGHGMLTLSPDKQVGLWSRVAGDGMDVAALLPALGPHNRKRDNVAVALAMVAGIAIIDVIAAQGVTARHGRGGQGFRNYADRSGFPQGLTQARRVASDARLPSAIEKAG